MAAAKHDLKHLNTLHIPCVEDGTTSFGCDQEWFGTQWQRRAGCGPNVATNLMMVLTADGRISLPFDLTTRKGCVGLMDAIWQHVTPTMMGVNTTIRFTTGLRNFAFMHHVPIRCAMLDVPRSRKKRPTTAEVVAFVRDGLSMECPVAFLNLHNGDIPKLDSWHWVTIVSLETDDEAGTAVATAYDGDKAFPVDLVKWCAGTNMGGGFVRLAGTDAQRIPEKAEDEAGCGAADT